MFDDRVYKRGALALHVLRRRIGDENFFALLRDWTARLPAQHCGHRRLHRHSPSNYTNGVPEAVVGGVAVFGTELPALDGPS